MFRDMAQNLTEKKQNTAAQSSWSNRLNEYHNGLLNVMVIKTIEDVSCILNKVLGWVRGNTQNSLHNVNGFSCIWLKSKSIFCTKNQLPGLESISSHKIVTNNLNTLHATKRASAQSALYYQI